MTDQLLNFAARLPFADTRQIQDNHFNELALNLFALQFKCNEAYQIICRASGSTPETIKHWRDIPFVPTTAFKELELSCIPPEQRTAVFHSSGTTEQKPSRHFHSAESLKIYESALWTWFEKNVLASKAFEMVALTPPPPQAPRSSLVHMFETIRRWYPPKNSRIEPLDPMLNAPQPALASWTAAAVTPLFIPAHLTPKKLEFTAGIGPDGAWILDFPAALKALNHDGNNPKLILGTAFSFVHLLDFLAEQSLRLQLPAGSRVMETGGYKNRSRTMPKAELHSLITECLGVSRENIICEYGMSELSSQAYDAKIQNSARVFRFPPWARVQIISPETGREVSDGETGLIRIFDLANIFSVAAIQTEDLAVRRGDGFELVGRVTIAEPRGCSLMTA